MNAIEIILVCAIGIAFFAAIVLTVRRKGKCCSLCNGDCAHCHAEKQKKN